MGCAIARCVPFVPGRGRNNFPMILEALSFTSTFGSSGARGDDFGDD